MEWFMTALHTIFKHSPEVALFLSLALGYWVGKFKFGSFQLGGVAGSLLVAVIVSQVGVNVDPGVKSILFALFIYAVGYESGPQFFRSLNKKSLREIALAAVLALTGLATVVITAKIFGFDKGLAAGIAAGGLTQSAIIGTAGDALAKLGMTDLQGNVAVGYAVTYIFGSFGTIIVCVNILPKFMGRGLRDDAIAAEAEAQSGAAMLTEGQEHALNELVGRLYRVERQANKTIAQIEQETNHTLTVERVKRAGKIIPITPDMILQAGDIALVVGRREAVLKAAPLFGQEVYNVEDMQLIMVERDIIVNGPAAGKTLAQAREAIDSAVRHGVYTIALRREGNAIRLTPDTVIQMGDVLTLYGSEDDIKRFTSTHGLALTTTSKTDFVYMGAGLVVGLLIGLVSVKLGGLPITLGSGGGALLSGLLFGWYRAKRQTFGAMPTAAIMLLKDLGLAGFVVVIGLTSGLQAVQTIAEKGWSIFIAGMIVTIVPLLLTMLIGRYVLGYHNTAIFAGALSGSRSANPAFGEILSTAGNSVPTVPFAITYALANVFLTLLGPLVVALA